MFLAQACSIFLQKYERLSEGSVGFGWKVLAAENLDENLDEKS